MITSPSGPPNTENDDQSHSVTTTVPNPYVPWIQVGWDYTPGMGEPLRYYEFWNENGYHYVPYGYLPWGTELNYMVFQDGSQNLKRWCARIGNDLVTCGIIYYNAPCTVRAQSEDHFSPSTTVFFTNFKSIQVRNAGVNDWHSANILGNMYADDPYRYTITSVNSFQTWNIGNSLPTTFNRSLP